MVRYPCSRCGYASTNKSHFLRHLRRKYPCPPTLSEISVADVFRGYFNDNFEVNNAHFSKTLLKMTPIDPERPILTPIDPSSTSPAKPPKRPKTHACAGCGSQFSKNSHKRRHEKNCPKKQHLDELEDLDQQVAVAERKIRLREVESPRQVHIGNNTNTNNTKNNNTRVPKPLRKQVWLKRNGNVIEGKCYVCIGAISYDTFESGHVKAASTGGETTLQNLEPICKTCNNDMGIEDLEQFKKVWYAIAGVQQHEQHYEPQHDQHKSSGIQGH